MKIIVEDSLNIIHDVDNIPIFKYIGDFNKKSIANDGIKTIHRGHAAFHKSVFKTFSYKDVRLIYLQKKSPC